MEGKTGLQAAMLVVCPFILPFSNTAPLQEWPGGPEMRGEGCYSTWLLGEASLSLSLMWLWIQSR
jgi:hypothetical protein